MEAMVFTRLVERLKWRKSREKSCLNFLLLKNFYMCKKKKKKTQNKQKQNKTPQQQHAVWGKQKEMST